MQKFPSQQLIEKLYLKEVELAIKERNSLRCIFKTQKVKRYTDTLASGQKSTETNES